MVKQEPERKNYRDAAFMGDTPDSLAPWATVPLPGPQSAPARGANEIPKGKRPDVAKAYEVPHKMGTPCPVGQIVGRLCLGV